MPDEPAHSPSYASSGVDQAKEEQALPSLLGWLNKTFDLPGAVGRPVLENGFFAAVHDLGNNLGLAVGTDGVGTKLMIAEALDRYDTVGIDVIAMNVNDILCVGARPFALVDYLAVQAVRPEVLEALGRGLYEGAKQAGIAIAGGEMAQVPEMLHGQRPDSGFDLAATALGIVPVSAVIDGRAIQDGDVVVGYRSAGLHSNGYTLARKLLLSGEGLSLSDHVPALGSTLGDELLVPTRIYVKPVLEALERSSGGISGLAHITGGGLLNLLRLRTDCGFELDDLPQAPPIFPLLQAAGGMSLQEMYPAFNMGVGFCAVARPEAVPVLLETARSHGYEAQVIGHARRALQGKVALVKERLIGEGHTFQPVP